MKDMNESLINTDWGDAMDIKERHDELWRWVRCALLLLIPMLACLLLVVYTDMKTALLGVLLLVGPCGICCGLLDRYEYKKYREAWFSGLYLDSARQEIDPAIVPIPSIDSLFEGMDSALAEKEVHYEAR